MHRAIGWPRTLRGRVILLILLSLVPEAFLSVNDAVEERQLDLRTLRLEARRLSEFAALQYGASIAAGERLLHGMAAQPEIAAPVSGPRCRQALRQLLRMHPQFSDLRVLRADGGVACSGKALPAGFDPASEGYFREALATGRFVLSDFEPKGSDEAGELVLALALRGRSQNESLVMTASLGLSWLSDFSERSALSPGVVVSVADRDGILLARYPAGEYKPGTPAYARDPAFTRVIAERAPADEIELEDLDGMRRIFSFRPIRGASSAIYVGVGVPVDLAGLSVEARLYRKIGLAAVGALAVLLLSWWGMGRFLAQPLQALTGAAARLGRGDLSARTKVASGGSELSSLAASFNRMAEDIDRRERALRTLLMSNHALIRSDDERELMHDICRAAVQEGGYRVAWVGWAERDERKTLRVVAHAGDHSGFLDNMNVTWDDSEYGRGVSGTAARSGHMQVVNDAATEPRLAPWREQMARHGFASVVSLPVRLDGQMSGVFTIYAGMPHAFTQEALKLLERLADDLSFGLSALRTRDAEKQAREALHRTAYYDPLTGLPNRVWLRQRLGEAIVVANGGRGTIALLLFSVDNYREIANTLGSQESEKLMGALVPRFERVAREAGGELARVHSGEFALLLQPADAAHAAGVARKLLFAMEDAVQGEATAIYMHGSVGLALFPADADDVSLLLRRAAAALEHAQKGGGGPTAYERFMDDGAAERLAMAAALKHAIENDELLVYCQPKVDLATRRVTGAEALVRWRHPAKGLVSPAFFIPLAERTGLIKPLTYWMLRAACRQANAWRQAGLWLPLAVNLSARNLRDSQLVHTIAALFATWRIAPTEIELELTESTLMEDPAGAREVIGALHGMGIPLYIDDFGTGYSSLAYLERLPVDAVKIDQSFVASMEKSEGAAKIVRSTIELAHNLGMKAVAEGIETAQGLERLAAMGCDGGQGYYIARPMPAADVAAWLAGSPWKT